MTRAEWITKRFGSTSRRILRFLSEEGRYPSEPVKLTVLPIEDVLAGYDAGSQLYPHIPPMATWRAWEYAAFRHYTLSGRVLDVGCGDGAFFRLVWPQVRDVVGIDIGPGVAERAKATGIYREVHVTPAHLLPFKPSSFESAFANCSLEHMDHLPEVLENISYVLRPGGTFLLSVVTDKLLEWATLPLLLRQTGEESRAQSIQADYEAFHHLINPFPPEIWVRCLEDAGFEVLEHFPVLPELTSRLFLFLDNLWHIRRRDGELGDIVHPFLTSIPDFPEAYRKILEGVLRMEGDPSVASGAVFWARQRR